MTSGDRTWLLRRVAIDDTLMDCRFDSRSILSMSTSELVPQQSDEVVEGRRGAVIPGLVDHHAHILATAALSRSHQMALDEPFSALAERLPPGTGWLRVTGCGVRVSRAELDRYWPDRPVRVAHRSGALWTLNTPAISALREGLTAKERSTGELWRADERLRGLIDEPSVGRDDVRRFGERLAGLGIATVTDATPTSDRAAVELIDALPQSVVVMGDPHGRGPVKVVVADTALPAPEELAATIDRAHCGGRTVGVHVVSREALALALGAFASVGVLHGDRLEHVALCDDTAADRIADLGLTVVTQPALWRHRHLEYLRETPDEDHRDLWRFGSLRARGIPTVASSDAPYGPDDPWAIVHASSGGRPRTPGYAEEQVAPDVVLDGMLADPLDPGGQPRRLVPGGPADLVLLAAPRAQALERVGRTGETPVRSAFLGGRWYPSTEPVSR